MTCTDIQTRMLELPMGTPPGSDLRTHLGGCPACTAVWQRMTRLDMAIAAEPIPDSSIAKAAFLATLTGPVVPSTVARKRSDAPRAWQSPAVRALVAVAAVLLIAVTAVSLWPRKSADPGPVEFALVRHQLFDQSVTFVIEQAGSATPEQRFRSSTAYAGHLMAEVRGIYQVATPNDSVHVKAAADLFTQVLRDGVVERSETLANANPVDRKALLDPLMPDLAALAQTARQMALSAPEHSRNAIEQMEKAANSASDKLASLGATRTSPGALPPPAGRDAGRELIAFKANRGEIERLTSRGLKAAKHDDATLRAEEIRAAAADIESALAAAVVEENVERTAELGQRWATLMTDGVIPTVAAAAAGAGDPQSPAQVRVTQIRTQLKRDAERARLVIPATGRFADLPVIQSTRQRMTDAAAKVL